MPGEFTGKVVLVTGGSIGIGHIKALQEVAPGNTAPIPNVLAVHLTLDQRGCLA